MPTSSGHSPAWSDRLRAALDAADVRARALAAPLSVAQLNWRADPGSWSIGQCLDHLRVTNDVYAHAMDESLTGTPVGPVEAITPGWFGRYFLRHGHRTIAEDSQEQGTGEDCAGDGG